MQLGNSVIVCFALCVKKLRALVNVTVASKKTPKADCTVNTVSR